MFWKLFGKKRNKVGVEKTTDNEVSPENKLGNISWTPRGEPPICITQDGYDTKITLGDFTKHIAEEMGISILKKASDKQQKNIVVLRREIKSLTQKIEGKVVATKTRVIYRKPK